MKVVYLLDSLNRGGTEILALDVCKNAKANGLELLFVATGDGTLEDDFSKSGVEFIRLNRRYPIDFKLVISLRNLIKSQEIDVIHAHQPVEAIHAYFATKGTKAKVVFSHHGFIPDKKNLFALRFLLPRVHQNIVCSQSLLDWYKNDVKLNFPTNTKIINNGVDAKRLVFDDDNIRRELGLTEDSLLFGMIGNFYNAPRKDQLTICQALPKIFAEIPNSYSIFVGKTESGAEKYFAECQRICAENNISNRVIFAGIRSDIPKILNSLDIFVLSSLHEGFPIAVLEAMLSNVPCILSDIKPLLEISNNGQIAGVFETQNTDDLSEKVIQLAKNKQLRVELANKAKIFANENYTIGAHIEKLKTLYQSIV